MHSLLVALATITVLTSSNTVHHDKRLNVPRDGAAIVATLYRSLPLPQFLVADEPETCNDQILAILLVHQEPIGFDV